MKMKNIMVDTHSHYAHAEFDSDRKEILKRLVEHNIVAVIEAAIDYDSNEKMKRLCDEYSAVYMAVGCHPNCVAKMDEQKFHVISNMLSQDKVVAIGETGLDYAHETSPEQKELQKYWFHRFIDLSISSRNMLVVHCREAYTDLIAILKQYSLSEIPGVIHCFSGNSQQAMELIKMGFYLGIGGKFTRMKDESELVQAIRDIPIEWMVLETDAPFLIPNGVDDTRNTSANLKYIVEEIARVKSCEYSHIVDTILDNTKRVYPQVF